MWRSFWDGLNIRKFLAVILVIAYVCVSGSIILFAFRTTDRELMKDTVSSVALVLGLVMGYYFGYTTGQNAPTNPLDND